MVEKDKTTESEPFLIVKFYLNKPIEFFKDSLKTEEKEKEEEKTSNSSESKMPKLLTIKETAKWLKEQYPDVKLTESAIRYMVKTGQISAILIGATKKKYLVNIEKFIKFLNNPTQANEDENRSNKNT